MAGKMTDDLVSPLKESGSGPVDAGRGTVEERQESELRELVMEAFAAARSKKPDSWQSMTTAVLKNRLLQVTGGSFDEKTWGFSSTRALVASLSDILEIDDSTRPPTVRLRTGGPSATDTPLGPKVRVRRDLWNAIIDFADDPTWVWVDDQAAAVDDTDTTLPVLPTLTPAEMQQWRDDFVEQHEHLAAGDQKDRLHYWRTVGGATLLLPPTLRPLWNGYLKEGVASRLVKWFESRGETVPEDLLVPVARQDRAGGQAAPTRSDSLRAFVMGCVSVMTEEELAQVKLPAELVYRYANRRA
jgi:hypothetical protein